MTTQHEDSVKARPTKAFFVEMLVKDVSLLSAIMDLVDNTVDGALRVRGDGSLDGLFVLLTIQPNHFEIKDNCGGISVELAKEYAFRFGRDVNAPIIKGSVGLFGVGMKRAVFKLGRQFQVRSTSARNSFDINVNVVQWQSNDSEPWTFPMLVEEYVEDTLEEQRGTTVTVSDLYEGVKSRFELPLFASSLEHEIAARHQIYLERGLNIKINGSSVAASAPQFAYTADRTLRPAYEDLCYNGVAVRLFAGIGDTNVDNAGWYVYCNGRMVVKADQTKLTGWGELGTTRIPKYHHQFSRFRGCAFLDSENPSSLPWNTTKDGLDVESDIYRTVRLEMVLLMRPVIDFLNRLDQELEEPEEKRLLTALVARAEYLPPTRALPTAPSFHYEKPPPRPRRPRTVRIQYDRPTELVDRVKKCVRARSAREAGEKTFDWYLENECRDE